jgi:hypothetical protein
MLLLAAECNTVIFLSLSLLCSLAFLPNMTAAQKRMTTGPAEHTMQRKCNFVKKIPAK